MIESVSIHKLIETIISVLDARDPYTFEHSWRVASISELIAKKMNLDKELIERIHIAAHLHDIGKVGVPDHILNKHGALSSEEFDIIKSHSRIGYNIINKIEILSDLSPNILHHHERWDGLGYPFGLKGKEIPIGARIIAIADTFDAMTTKRSYKSAVNLDDAFSEIKRVQGAQLCPDSVDCFLSMKDEMENIIQNVNLDIIHSAFNNEENSYNCRAL